MRFVILRHEMPDGSDRPSHWDLMLEDGPRLRTWALPAWPEAHQSLTVDGLPDHRPDYLEREGTVSGGRGKVKRCDRGRLQWIVNQPHHCIVRVDGQRLQAELRLRREAADQRWRLETVPLVERERA